MKKLAILLMSFYSLVSFGQGSEGKPPITVTELAKGINRLLVNNAVSVVSFSGDDGLLIIDTGYDRTAESLKEKLLEVSPMPLKYIVNTHIHGDHTGGNAALGKGVDIIAHTNVRGFLGIERKVGDRVIPALPDHALPNITFTDRMMLRFNGEEMQLIHLPEGHTNGDIIIYLPNSKVLVVGDLLFADYFPYVDTLNGGNPMKYLKNIDWITAAFPNDVKVVGGHGPLYTMEKYRQYRQVLQQTIDVVAAHKAKGLTAEQLKQQGVLKEWHSYGSFFITEDRWIDTIYSFL